MKNNGKLVIALTGLFGLLGCVQPLLKDNDIIELKYVPVPISDIQPEGWLKNQLDIMCDGSSGHLDEIYDKVKNDNAWLGGKGDAWEETPYWLDGAVPLAYLTKDKGLIAKVEKYINWSLDNQRPSGYFGPITTYERESGKLITTQIADKGEDWWPRMIMLKVMQQYYSATHDERVITFMSKYFQYQEEALKNISIGHWSEWSQARGIENINMILWLYRITRKNELLCLADRIRKQSFQWTEWFEKRDWVMGAAANQNGENWMERHSVNVAMAMKSPAIDYLRTGNTAFLAIQDRCFKDLMLLHGLPNGCISGDEDIHGNEPSQGTELCTIVESMYSLENIIAITGKNSYMDALERIAFNALPAQTTDDYNYKQYFQIPNQPQACLGSFDFSLTAYQGTSNVYGTASGYTCCYANMHQGWTKFTSSLWYSTPDEGIAALIYAPSRIITKLRDANLSIWEETNYPFEENIRFHFTLDKETVFPFHLRIPSWCEKAQIYINGQKGEVDGKDSLIVVNRKWKNGHVLELRLPMSIFISNWARNSHTVERGPLIYGLKIKERWEEGHSDIQGNYWSVFPESKWNYALHECVINDPATHIKVSYLDPVDSLFVWNQAHAPIELVAPAKQLPWWKSGESGVLKQPVTDREGYYKGLVGNNEEQICLIPYGCTKIRIVAFPVVR